MRSIFEIMLSTACNARCAYCYESSSPVETMTSETERAMLDFIATVATSGEPVRLVWFGGEPLLFARRILELHSEIDEILAKANAPSYSILITNGAAIATPAAQALLESGLLDAVQVSMDGCGPVHMARKRFCDESLAFDDLMANIGYLLDLGIEVAVRINIGRSNLASCVELARLLKRRFGGEKRLRCYPAVLYGNWQDRSADILAPDMVRAAYEEIAAACGLEGYASCTYGACFSGNHTYVIAPRGDVYSCEHLVGREDCRIGNVTSAEGILSIEPREYCRKCPNRQLCHLGCFESIDGFDECYCWRRRAKG